jgi:NAD(P)-dependent dehydrogenase (short-subunit alcohol dehydrogenase family)
MKTWFITGVSGGLGAAIANAVLAAGHRVVGTARQQAQVEAFSGLAGDRSIGIKLDVGNEAGVSAAIDRVESEFGAIDVLVNNAGYGLQGAVEETSMAEIRQQFEVNVFGLIAVTKAVLPHMRARRAGHIFNLSSMGGLTTFPGLSIYSATKFAVEGLSEGLAKEVAAFGIKVTLVEPGGFRTDWAGRSMNFAANTIEDYAASSGASKERLASRNGRQPGDPTKLADVLLHVAELPDPPLHLLLGSEALLHVGKKLGDLQTELARWAPLTVSTDYPDSSA